MNVRVWIRDDEFGEDFAADATLTDMIVALKHSGLPWVERVADDQGHVKLWRTSKPSKRPGVWFCVRVGDE